jgi:hypothetical protein
LRALLNLKNLSPSGNSILEGFKPRVITFSFEEKYRSLSPKKRIGMDGFTRKG